MSRASLEIMEINYTYSYDSSRAKIYKNPMIISTWVIQRKALLCSPLNTCLYSGNKGRQRNYTLLGTSCQNQCLYCLSHRCPLFFITVFCNLRWYFMPSGFQLVLADQWSEENEIRTFPCWFTDYHVAQVSGGSTKAHVPFRRCSPYSSLSTFW